MIQIQKNLYKVYYLLEKFGYDNIVDINIVLNQHFIIFHNIKQLNDDILIDLGFSDKTNLFFYTEIGENKNSPRSLRSIPIIFQYVDN